MTATQVVYRRLVSPISKENRINIEGQIANNVGPDPGFIDRNLVFHTFA